MTTYIDVTRLLTWQGNYTGMERVAYEITQVLLAQKTEAAIQLCCYTPGRGFVLIGDQYKIANGRLVSSLLAPAPSLKQLVKQNKAAFVKHSVKRLRRRGQHQRLATLSTQKSDNLLIYDGLWDQQGYIDAVLATAQQGAALIHLVCDAIPVVMPHVCLDFVSAAFDNYFRQVAPCIDTLLSISRNTQKDFEAVYGPLLKPSINKVVLRLADDFDRQTKPLKPSSLDVQPGSYLLAVGTVEIRKNYQLLYQVYRLAHERGVALPPLVIVGREGWLTDALVYSVQHDPVTKDSIVFAGSKSDAELNWLYANCLFTVSPSVYEGWGLPVAESLFYEKVCAASSSSSLPEVGGKLNSYYSPYDPQACLDVMTELLDEPFRQKMEQKIRDNYQPTSWQQTAEQVLRQL